MNDPVGRLGGWMERHGVASKQDLPQGSMIHVEVDSKEMSLAHVEDGIIAMGDR